MPNVVSVLYHNISDLVTDFESGLNVTTSIEIFESHISYFTRNYDIIDLDTLLSGRLPRKPLLLTFDDCYKSVLEVGRGILKPRGIPSVFFINPSLLGEREVSLDCLLSWHANNHGLSALCHRMGLDHNSYGAVGGVISGPLTRMGAAERQTLRHRLLTEEGPGADELAARCPILSDGDLAAMPSLGIEVGNHTASHVHCRALSEDEIRTEIAEAKSRLEALSGARVRAFSVPYGHECDATPEVMAALRESGHEAVFLVHARSNRFRQAPDIWYRVSLDNEPAGGLWRQFHALPLLRSLKTVLKPSRA